MTVQDAITVAFLVVSVVGLVVQVWALTRLWRTEPGPGLVRTSACRVACAVLYIVVGLNAWCPQWAVLQVTFVAFCLTQATWQINALLDVRLGRRRRPRARPGPRLRERTRRVTAANLFVDCSSNNTIPNLAEYKKAGHTHICRKVSEGVGYHWLDGDNVAGRAHQLGLRVGHYHWLRPDQSPVAQAAFFVTAVKGQLKPGDWLMTDFERTANVNDPSDVERAAQLHAFNAYVRQHLPAFPLYVYTGNWYLAGKPHCQAEVRRWPIVMSDYSATVLPNPYRLNYVAWQFSQTATVAGFRGHVDYNRWITPPLPPEREFTVLPSDETKIRAIVADEVHQQIIRLTLLDGEKAADRTSGHAFSTVVRQELDRAIPEIVSAVVTALKK